MNSEKIEKETKTHSQIEAYTDGACSHNPGPGGWGAYILFGNLGLMIKGYSAATTNNQMEMLAAIKALEATAPNSQVVIYTDSIYLQKGMTEWVKGWQTANWKTRSGSPVKNVDLWKRLLELVQTRSVHWAWVQGHSSNLGNQIADKLANLGKNKTETL
jgi:ribonuclease HI